MWLEETHDRCHEVPGQVDDSQEGDGLDGNLVGEQGLDVVEDGAAGSRFDSRAPLSLGGPELLTLFQLALQRPGDEGHDEEREEDHAGGEDLHGGFGSIGSDDSVRHGLHEAVEITAGSEQHTEQQDDHRTHAPRHLGDADVASAVADFGTLGDIRPRGRHADAHGDARDEEAAQQHGEVRGEHDDEHPQHVHQQVVGEDELAAELVGQEAADDGTDGCSQGVGADGIEPSEMYLAQPEVVLPQRDAAGTRHDGSCIEIVVQGDRDGTLQGG